MPFQEQSIMDQKREFVALAEQGDIPFAELCRRFAISRPTGYKWLGRWRAEGTAGLTERSRRPHTSPGQTPSATEARVVALRDQHPTWGGQKLRTRLRQQGADPVPVPVPAASTITAILDRHGRLDPTESAKHTPWRRFEHAAPNDLWQLDFKGHFSLATGRCHPLSVLDDHSRYLLGLTACADEQDGTVRATLTQLFRHYGLPWRILTDNGPPWGSPGQDLTALGVWLLRLGIRPVHGRPLHPQTQGKVERFHRTLKADVLRDAAYPDLAGAQAAFTGWQAVYNHERPHHALDLAVPASRYRPSLRPFPEVVPPLAYGPEDEVRIVARSGQVHYRNRAVFVSQALAGQRVAVRPTPTDGVLAMYFGQAPLGTVDLHQPTLVLDRTAAQPVVGV
jgi:transposase InsO family protein